MSLPDAAVGTVATDRAQLHVEDVTTGDRLPEVAFPLNVYRLAMAAGSNRDFNSIHHNPEYARESGAPDAYANVLLLMGMWERAVRDWIGSRGEITAFRSFAMKRFNLLGTTTTVSGEVVAVDPASGAVSIRLRSDDGAGTTVGPAAVEVRLPRRSA